MDSLPIFLSLIKNSILLNTLLTNGTFCNTDLSEYTTKIYSNTAIEFINIRLTDNDIFDTILYSKIPNDSSDSSSGVVQLTFTTRDPKYFKNIEYYFHLGTSNFKFRRISDSHIDLGYMQLFEPPFPPAFISVLSNPQYGFGVYVSFYKNFMDRIKVWDQLFGQ